MEKKPNTSQSNRRQKDKRPSKIVSKVPENKKVKPKKPERQEKRQSTYSGAYKARQVTFNDIRQVDIHVHPYVRDERTYVLRLQYNGEYNEEGQRHGFGTDYYEDSHYEGNWRNDKEEGIGTLKFEDKSEYKGHWEQGSPSGQGTYESSLGFSYKGNF